MPTIGVDEFRRILFERLRTDRGNFDLGELIRQSGPSPQTVQVVTRQVYGRLCDAAWVDARMTREERIRLTRLARLLHIPHREQRAASWAARKRAVAGLERAAQADGLYTAEERRQIAELERHLGLGGDARAWRTLTPAERRFVRRRRWGAGATALGMAFLTCMACLFVFFESLYPRATPFAATTTWLLVAVMMYAARSWWGLDDFRPVCICVRRKEIEDGHIRDARQWWALALLTGEAPAEVYCLITTHDTTVRHCPWEIWQSVRPGRGYRMLRNARTGEWHFDQARELSPAELETLPNDLLI